MLRGLLLGAVVVVSGTTLHVTASGQCPYPSPRWSPPDGAWARFSSLALISVVVLIATGIVNSMLQLNSMDQL